MCKSRKTENFRFSLFFEDPREIDKSEIWISRDRTALHHDILCVSECACKDRINLSSIKLLFITADHS